jgi:hypothetical protein
MSLLFNPKQMYEKIGQSTKAVAIVLLAILAVIFAAYGLYQGTNVAKIINYNAGYQQCVVDVNNQVAAQQKAQEANVPTTNITTDEKVSANN